MSDLLTSALELAGQGFYVFPCTPRGKVPIGQLVPQGKDNATTDPAIIRSWWSLVPDANIGIATAKSGLIVLDVDVADDKQGRASLATIDSQLEPTLTAVTGSGGIHAYYARNDIAPFQRIGALPGIDIIGNGYVIAPPSVHASGNQYTWANQTRIAACPAVLVTLKREHSQVKASDVGRTKIDQGDRNNALFRLGAALRATGIGTDSVRAALHLENRSRFVPQLDDAEVEAVAVSVMARVQPERDVAAGSIVTEQLHAFVGGLPQDVAGSEYGADDFIGIDDPGDSEDNWLVKGLVAAGEPQMTAGHPKAYKTFLMEYLTLCIATGFPAFGRFPVTRARCLILPREDSKKETQRRYWRLARGLYAQQPSAPVFNSVDLKDWLRIDSTQPFYWSDMVSMEKLDRTIENWQPKLIVIDSLSRTHIGDENSAKEMAPIMNLWADRCQRYLLAISMIHHFTKSGSGTLLQQLRGSGSIGAVLRHVIGVEKASKRGEPFELSFDGNLHPLHDPFMIQMKDSVDTHGKKTIVFDYIKQSVPTLPLAQLWVNEVREKAAKGEYKSITEWGVCLQHGPSLMKAAWAEVGPGSVNQQLDTAEINPTTFHRLRSGCFVVPKTTKKEE